MDCGDSSRTLKPWMKQRRSVLFIVHCAPAVSSRMLERRVPEQPGHVRDLYFGVSAVGAGQVLVLPGKTQSVPP